MSNFLGNSPVNIGVGVAPSSSVSMLSEVTSSGYIHNVALGHGYTASSYQWTLKGADIAGEISSMYTAIKSDDGAALSVKIIGLKYKGIDVVDNGFGHTYHAVINNKIIILGDSRTDSSEEGSGFDVSNLTVTGYASWLQTALFGNGIIVGGYGQNADNTAGLYARMIGSVSGSNKDNILTLDPGKTASIAVVLIGVNDGSSLVDKANYDLILMTLLDTGKRVILCNEIPANRTDELRITTHLARRDYLDGWPISSPTMSAEQKLRYSGRVNLINTWDQVATSHRSPLSIVGMYSDDLHPQPAGSKELGTLMAKEIQSIIPKFYKGLHLPTSTDGVLVNRGIQLTGGFPLVSSNLDGEGGIGILGVRTYPISRSFNALLDGTQNIGNFFQIRTTEVLDEAGYPSLELHCKGLVTGTSVHTITLGSGNEFMAPAEVVAAVSDGDEIVACAGIKLYANSKGLRSLTFMGRFKNNLFNSTGNSIFEGRNEQASHLIEVSRSEFSGIVTTPPYILPVGYTAGGNTTKECSLKLTFRGGNDVDFKIRVGRFMLINNSVNKII